MTARQRERLEALQRLVARPDAFDRQRRSTVTQPGDPRRFALLAMQTTVYQQHVLVARENGDSRLDGGACLNASLTRWWRALVQLGKA